MKNFLIIGGSSGIGQAIVSKLSEQNANIYTTYFKNEAISDHENVQFQYLDVLEEINLANLPDKLDGIVYCPGSINLKPFHRMKSADFADDFNLQVLGAIKTIQHVLPKLKKSQGASIVLFSSVAVQQGFNFHSQVSTSKGAIEGLTRALSAELSPTVRVNCIAPSLTDTPLAAKLLSSEEKREVNSKRHPLNRIGTPQDIASIADFLLNDSSSWITGQILHVDGGMSSLKI
jgi:NAD(P)-dependent dehydrogenase (short-subunit alcohol dehydrogenase family)